MIAYDIDGNVDRRTLTAEQVRALDHAEASLAAREAGEQDPYPQHAGYYGDEASIAAVLEISR
jgi:hypothetical protein